MAKLLERLQDPAKSGVYRTSRVHVLEDAVRGSRLSYARIVISAKDSLFQDMARALAFPDWFGGNWDALEDCLTDFSWREAHGYVLAIEGFRTLPDAELGEMIDVLISAAEFWAGQHKPFFAVLIDPERTLGLLELFRET
jgi:RNAse (barnase) inhibitor barstar